MDQAVVATGPRLVPIGPLPNSRGSVDEVVTGHHLADGPSRPTKKALDASLRVGPMICPSADLSLSLRALNKCS